MRCWHFIERNKKRGKKEMATGQSPDADAARKSRPVAGAGARLYTASTATRH